MYVCPQHRPTDREALFVLVASHPLGAWVCPGRDGLIARLREPACDTPRALAALVQEAIDSEAAQP